jgi:hypothetical protein
MCENWPGMKISDDTLIDFATTCSDRGLQLKAEKILCDRARVS